MPYIKTEFRAQASKAPVGSGELNYKLTLAIIEYIERSGTNYSVFNEVVGALDCCKAEFQRRIVAPYEDHKRCVNGDVYPVAITRC